MSLEWGEGGREDFQLAGSEKEYTEPSVGTAAGERRQNFPEAE